MDWFSLLIVSGSVFLLALAPAPSVYLVIARASSHGLAAASVVILGLVLGDVIFLAVVVTGLVSVAQNFDLLFESIKLIGGLYLFYLAWKSWTANSTRHSIESANTHWISGLLSGLLLTLSDPRAMVFYASFLPAYVNLERLSVGGALILCLLIPLVVALAKLLYALAVVVLRQRVQPGQWGHSLNRVAAVLMGVTGLILWWPLLMQLWGAPVAA